MPDIIDHAQAFARVFGAVVPLGAWTYTNKKGEEVSCWKVPIIKRWNVEPLRTEKQVFDFWYKQWYQYRKTPQLGLVTGQINGGYVVIDLDRGHQSGVDGYETLKEWQRMTGNELPETWTVITGSGGYHFYYHTDKAMRCYSNPDLGVDFKADGGYVVCPPSLHQNGNKYQWEITPSDCECAELDEIVLEFIEYCRPGGYQYDQGFRASERRDQDNDNRKMILPPEIPEGGRHTPLISLIGTLNRLGVSDEAIEAMVRTENELKCKPAFTETELQKEIFPAIYRWPKGFNADDYKGQEEWKQQRKKQLNVERYLQSRMHSD